MKKWTFGALMCALWLALAACGGRSVQEWISDTIAEELGLSVQGGQILSADDDHGGFHGDGTAFARIKFSDSQMLEQIQKSGQWKAFPLDETVQALVYGVTEQTGTEETGIAVYQTGPYLTDDDNNLLIPEIQEGYYRLIDRHPEAEEGTDILHRYAFNFTLGIYDTETNTLYFFQLDT